MTVALDGDSLEVADVVAVARHGEPVSIAPAAREAVREARTRVEDVVSVGDPVYGVNTGFGELVDQRIPPERLEELQSNLLRSHAAGTGRELDREEVRAMLLTRLNALLSGYSGVRIDVVDALAALLNEGVHPVVPSRGSLGASGDLAPLAHLALVLVGEGEADVDIDGSADGTRRLPGDEALATAGLEPLSLRAKEGLALINGTQLTLGLAALFVHDAERLCRAADAAGALTTEVTMGTTASCAPAVHDARPHPGSAESARVVRQLTVESEVVESHRNCDRVQDAYSIRCLPQVHGAVRDAVSHLRDAVEVELDSATDNPLVFPREMVDDRASGTGRAAVVSAGNFHGEPLALPLDYAVGALTELASISERRVDRLLNPALQEPYLPPFLAREPGVESGLMIAQYTAASLVNECRNVGRAATDNVPVSGNQEDHVSMGATAALGARRTLDRARRVVATELLCGVEATEYLDPELSLGDGTESVRQLVRDVVPPLSGDRRLDGDLEAVASLIAEGLLDEVVRETAVESD
ncbi:Histidine ammonia-lyase [Halalkaliarchaeum sp. AArc-CO]|uniref:histidine ammonia-lyase n=1 Tax=unclassified Halalkaliarchaeum TaxID=2678344 RepID=UPI00217D1EB9|nr:MULTISPECIES: histidine ammonia-lyase [unclassified Halalkaliarchaeum]MDR5672745.1 histidine ammonia-lyase [Halalkaliarchaeum sp. AArc-GB]UWG49349.1 Histidine ammonia-lyase [Halalkaliarchaeum sp. AArc-CO]